uniref:Glutamine amidotransferase domain-containing protein n=1 Tax=Cucumis sativus TaxID=3659 RepID=A0A0A0K7I2_CUCSA
MLGEEGEIWDSYRVTAGHFPDDADIGIYDGFVVTGSCSDAHSNDPWICQLLLLLKKLNALKKKVLGICFGHQILCRALGGKTGRATSGWDIGIRAIHVSQSSSKALSSLKIPLTLSIIECHRDEVRELPLKAEVIGWSEKTRIEMFKYGDHMMGIQGHPEYTMDILLHLIDRLVQHNLIMSLGEIGPKRWAESLVFESSFSFSSLYLSPPSPSSSVTSARYNTHTVQQLPPGWKIEPCL